MEEDNAAAPQTSVVLLPGEDAERGAHYDRASQILAVAASVESHMASLAAAAAGAKSAAFYAGFNAACGTGLGRRRMAGGGMARAGCLA